MKKIFLYRHHFSQYFPRLVLIVLCSFATACAHRINITPDINEIEAPKLPRVEGNVGYYISPENLKKEVITPGGGGDKVKYLPYKESEPALKAILSNIFFSVYSVPSLDDTKFIKSRNITYIFIPEIKTNSSSRSMWIWPPPDFFVTLKCKAVKPTGELIWYTSVNSAAHLGLPQVHFKRSLAGKVAVQKAFSKLQHEIHEQFYADPKADYSPPISVDSFDEGQGEYYSPQDHQKIIEPSGPMDSFDDGQSEYYSPQEHKIDSFDEGREYYSPPEK